MFDRFRKTTSNKWNFSVIPAKHLCSILSLPVCDAGVLHLEYVLLSRLYVDNVIIVQHSVNYYFTCSMIGPIIISASCYLYGLSLGELWVLTTGQCSGRDSLLQKGNREPLISQQRNRTSQSRGCPRLQLPAVRTMCSAETALQCSATV